MTYAKPQPGEIVTVTTRFKDDYYLAEKEFKEDTYVGEVLKDMRWFKDDQFAISSDDPKMPFRVISIGNVVSLKVGSEEGQKQDPNKGTRSVTITGSKGDEYVVTIVNGIPESCTCPGFTFRGQCRHLKTVVDTSNENQDNISDADRNSAQQTYSKEGKYMSNLKSNDMGWGTRLALIEHFDLSDDRAKDVFGVTDLELQTVRELQEKDAISVDKNVDFSKYESVLGGAVKPTKATTNKPTSTTKKTTAKPAPAKKAASKTTTAKPSNKAPVTATKPKKAPQKRGRKGDKIINAFKSVPNKPTEAEKFAAKHSVSMAVLRQAKRFDKTGEPGIVKVKKDRERGVLMIWREV